MTHWTQTPMLAQMAGLLLVGLGCIALFVWQQLTGEVWIQPPWRLRRRLMLRKDSPWLFWSAQALTGLIIVVSFGLLILLINQVMSVDS